jgi:anti-anti-sigma factor
MSLHETISLRRGPLVDLSFSDGSALVALAGELDISIAGELREQLARPEILLARQVCVDLNRVGFLDSSCVDLIVTACKRIRASGGSFSVACGARGNARRMFEVDGLVEYLQVGEIIRQG